MMQWNQDLEKVLIEAILKAGEITLSYYKQDIAIIQKSNESPVTIADQKAEESILKALKKIDSTIPIVAEEEFEAGRFPDHTTLKGFWLVDALDGTKSFIEGKTDYTVNIAYVYDGDPVFGLVYAPVLDELFIGDVIKKKAKLLTKQATKEEPIQVRDVPSEGLTIVASRHHRDPERLTQFIQGKAIKDILARGSSMKFCSIAAGRADLYPRFGRTCEWDTAAGDAVLRAAGGLVTTIDGRPFRYAKKANYKNPGFIGWGSLRPQKD